MFYQLLIYINLLGIFFFSWLTDQEISVKINAPAEVHAGETFQVKLSIEKGSVESFSRYIQDLPYGLSAERISSANADFSFEDQRVRLIWLKMPADSKITVSYNIKVDKRLKGNFELKGEFAYVEENERKSVAISGGQTITIIPSPDMPDSLIVDIKDFEQMLKESGANAEDFNKLAVTRSNATESYNHQYEITLRVKKGDLSRFAKIEEQVPTGYRAIEGNSQNGIFSFSQGVAKILWMNLPTGSEFIVSYNIIPDPGYSIENMNLMGTFSYITGNSTQTIAIKQKKYDLADNSTEQKVEDIDTIDVENDVETVKDTDTVETEDEIQETVKENYIEQNTLTDNNRQTQVPDLDSNEQGLMQSEAGIYYRIQLAAGHAEVNIEKYFKKRNISDKVEFEYHEGWRKYSTGSFSVYKDARDYRMKIWESTPIKDAFVSAYNDGRRITVQEALMVTNQNWYR